MPLEINTDEFWKWFGTGVEIKNRAAARISIEQLQIKVIEQAKRIDELKIALSKLKENNAN